MNLHCLNTSLGKLYIKKIAFAVYWLKQGQFDLKKKTCKKLDSVEDRTDRVAQNNILFLGTLHVASNSKALPTANVYLTRICDDFDVNFNKQKSKSVKESFSQNLTTQQESHFLYGWFIRCDS